MKKKSSTYDQAIQWSGGGGNALMAWPLVEEPFFAASLIHKIHIQFLEGI